MVNKKGWVRIIEATICAITIIAVVLLYAQDNKAYFNIEDYADVESVIDEMIRDKEIRKEIINTPNENLGKSNEYINNRLIMGIKRSGITINNTICSIDMASNNNCNMSKADGIKNVHVYERIIGANIDPYSFEKSKVLKIVIFEERR